MRGTLYNSNKMNLFSASAIYFSKEEEEEEEKRDGV